MVESGGDNSGPRTMGIPDFTHEALSHLQVQSDDFVLHVKGFLTSSDKQHRNQLQDDLRRFRNTLVILDKNAAVYVADELLTLLEVDERDELADRSELARVLVEAAERLAEHVALLKSDTSLDSALPLLPLVNDSRACRQESLLSESVVLAAGIKLPQPLKVSVGNEQWKKQLGDWVSFASMSHRGLAHALLQWWRSGDVAAAKKITPQLALFSDFCKEREFLSVMVPLFQSASLVADSIASTEISDGPALRSLYAQLERYIHRCILVAVPEDLLPQDLLRNFLYYVAQSDSTSRTAIDLRRQFRLDRVSQAASAQVKHPTSTIGVGYHLAKAIRASVADETEALREWLDQPDAAGSKPKLVRLKVRLSQLEPVLTLMGAPEPLACLQRINHDLVEIAGDVAISNDTRLRLAEALVELDMLLDESARYSVMRKAGNSLDEFHADEVFVQMSVDACLRESRLSLSRIADTVDTLLQANPFPIKHARSISNELHSVNQSLQILPLPEISPLLHGLIDLLVRLPESKGLVSNNCTDSGVVSNSIDQELAMLLVSIDYYLGCVLQPQAAASQLLVDAEESLLRARQLVDGHAANMPVNLSEEQWGSHIERLLPHMDALGLAIAHYRLDPSKKAVQSISEAFSGMNASADELPGSTIKLLSSATNEWFQQIENQSLPFSESILDLLDEIHAIVPQVFDQLMSGAEPLEDLDDLLERLQDCYSADLTGATEGPELTLNVDDKLLSDNAIGDEAAIDQTLQHVFYYECLSHLESLDESVRSALQPNADVSTSLPTEQMLRALHTLTGSAQTMDAPEIVAIVQPLQRAALARQRISQSFNSEETHYIGDLVMALRARLESLVAGEPVGQSIKAVESKLADFLNTSIPGAEVADSSLIVAANVRSLESVFVEEADDILQKLRALSQHSNYCIEHTHEALSLLHTLKGSARMAGKVAIAEHAHELESNIQEATATEKQQQFLQIGSHELVQFLFQPTELDSATASVSADKLHAKPAVESDTPVMSESGFDTLLDLATDVTVNQARLSDQLAMLREVYQDIDTLSLRFREIPKAIDNHATVDFQELVNDLEAARGVMRGALRQAEREQQQASRASAGLQQNLIRTRLVRVDEVSERLSQAVGYASRALGKQVEIHIDGGEMTLDRALFRQLLAPLEHLARNAVVHGIEDPAERERAGKAKVGRLTLAASMDGTDLVIQLSDDGKGIDRTAVSQLMQAKGEAPVVTHEELQQALFTSGFSSVDTPTELAGHGLGLSAVQVALEQLGGRVQLASNEGEGTQISIRVPQRIVVNQVVLVEADGVLLAIPVNYVDAVRLASASASIPKKYQRTSLGELLSGRVEVDHSDETRKRPSLLISAAGEALAVGVDQVIGYRELVTQALGPQIASLRRYSGGSVLSDGRIVLILDLTRIVELRSTEQSNSKYKPARESLRPVALIVDDSITMRVAAESVLQQCGIAVRMSRDGVEALDSIASALPNLILLDLEMPRLDGIGFLKRAKDKYGEAFPPVIVISSRDSSENRDHLRRLGAVRFLPKPYTHNQLQEAVEAAGLRLPDLTIA